MTNSRTHALRMWRLVASGLMALAILAACSAPEDVDGGDPDPTVTSVTIEGGADAITMRPGTARGLNFAVDAEGGASQDVTWTSDDEETATVDAAGIVTAQSIGVATITATSAEDPDVADSIDVRVSSEGAEWDLEIVQDEVVLEPGGTETLVFTSTVPDGESDAVDWTTADASVVTIDEDGTLTAVAEGDATVTGTLAANDGVSDTVAVTVSVDASVNIQQSDLSLYETESTTLSANVNVPDELDQDLTWTSDNEDVVTIMEDGATTATVTAEAVGTSTITVASVGDPSLTDSITVTVEEIIVDIDALDGDVPEGDEVQLDFSLGAPAGTGLIWSSDNEAVATVDDGGMLTAVGAGTAEIMATSEFDASASDSINVTVVAAIDPTDPTEPSVDIVQESLTLVAGTTDDTLTVTVSVPEGESEELVWSSEDEAVVTVADGVVTAMAEGSTMITAALASDTSVNDTVTVNVNPEGTEPPPSEEFDAIVTSMDDYDPYALQGWEGEEPITGTLREVLATAPSGSVIGFEEGITEIVLHGVDTLDVGDTATDNVDAHLIFRNDVTLVGPEEGLTIRGTSGYEAGVDEDDGEGGFTYRSRMMFVPEGVNVTLENLTITGGDFIFLGAGIRNDGTLTVSDSTITGNRAWTYGGGIFNNGGTLTLEDTLIDGNAAYTTQEELDTGSYFIRGGFEIDMDDTGYAGGVYVTGGDVSITGTSAIRNNDAKYTGGGISLTGGIITAVGTTISGNSADPTAFGTTGDSGGGGVAVYGGTFDFADGTITDNASLTYGGGLRLMSGGQAVLTNATFSGNSAQYGDAIFNEVSGDSPDNLTITGGNVEIGGEGYYPPSPAPSALRVQPTGESTLPDPLDNPEWMR